MMEFYNYSYPKARKPHNCEFCGRTNPSCEIVRKIYGEDEVKENE